MNELDIIHVQSSVSAINSDPNVIISWGDSIGILSATNTRKRAIALISAIAIAQTEGGIFKTLAPDMKPLGLGIGDIE